METRSSSIFSEATSLGEIRSTNFSDTALSSSKHAAFTKTESLLNMLQREGEVLEGESGGFHSKYEPREILGRY